MSTPKITVYTRNNCQACEGAKRVLKNADVLFETINVQDEGNDRYAEQLVGEGHRAMPVITVEYDEDGTWSRDRAWAGFRPGTESDENLRALINEVQAA